MTAKLHPNTETMLSNLTDEQIKELMTPQPVKSYDEIQKRLQLAFDPCAPTPEKAVIEGYVARDSDIDLWLYKTKPYRDTDDNMWISEAIIDLPSNLFPSITWQSEPRKARIEITLIDETE